MKIIKVGYLISYDYEYVKVSLSRVYEFADEIFFAVDADRLTWSGENFVISDDFWDWLKAFDQQQKIKIYEDRFYVPGLSAMECDTRERNMLGSFMGKADWYVQIDSDEYFIDFKHFINKLRNYTDTAATTIYCRVATLFKELPAGYLLIDNSVESLSIATNNPIYDYARNNTSGNLQVHWDDLIIHQSWARSDEQILVKLNNWSHKDDFNTASFYKLWSALDDFNYHCLHHFHPLNPVTWPSLKLLKGRLSEVLNSKAVMELGKAPAKPKKNLLSRIWREIKD